MPSADNIDQQQRLLETHRRTLAHLLQQATQYGGGAFAPSATINGIQEARDNIRRIKAILRDWGVEVEDSPADEPTGGSTTETSSRKKLDHEERQHLEALLRVYQRRLRVLERREAMYGATVDPSIRIEIEDLQKDIAEIARKLGRDTPKVKDIVEILNSLPVPLERRMTFRDRFFRARLAAEASGAIRTSVGFFGIALLLFVICIQVLALILPAPVHYTVMPGNIFSSAPPPNFEVIPPLAIVIVLISIITGIVAARSRRVSQAVAVIIASVVITLIIIVLAWNTPSASAAQSLYTPPSLSAAVATNTALTVSPYRADLLIDGPKSVRMWSSIPVTLTVSVITNTVDTAWPLPNKGPYTTNVAVQANNFNLAKDIDKIQGSQQVSINEPAYWIWSISPTNPYYDSQLVIFNVSMEDKTGKTFRPSNLIFINVTLFGFPGWVYIVGLAIGTLATLFGFKDILLRYIPQREKAPKPALALTTKPTEQPEAMPTIATLMQSNQPPTPNKEKAPRKKPGKR